eukprot:TRINITY_DN40884_c0_g1_i2.p1 TRINITY_DN40884_c0_g1~~TRINITY_DN40884_c0_g1_i2.p1  ORF type:complete len:279 (-),score=58.30 TRINITY_DN40884_c0_g1_i2:500-1336(-)
MALRPPLLLASRASSAIDGLGNARLVATPPLAGQPAAEDRSFLREMLDVFLSVGVVSHAVVIYWRGTWVLVDHYHWAFSPEPEDLLRTSMFSIAVGFGMYFFDFLRGVRITAAADLAAETPPPSRGRRQAVEVALFCRLYTYVQCFAAVNAWRGVWYLVDYYSVTLESVWAALLVGLFGLWCCGALRSSLAGPFVIGLDVNTVQAPASLARAAQDALEPVLQDSSQKSPKAAQGDASKATTEAAAGIEAAAAAAVDTVKDIEASWTNDGAVDSKVLEI